MKTCHAACLISKVHRLGYFLVKVLMGLTGCFRHGKALENISSYDFKQAIFLETKYVLSSNYDILKQTESVICTLL